MENKSTKCMYLGLDVGKFLCAFLILFYHYFSEHGSLPGLLGEALSLYAVAVALFMTSTLEPLLDIRVRRAWKFPGR